MSSLLIRNGTIVTATDKFLADVYIKDEKVTAIAETLKAVTHSLIRDRIKTGLLIGIGSNHKSISEAVEYLKAWLPKLYEGNVIEYSARYKSSGYDYFNAVLPDLPKYFSKDKFSRVLRYYKENE